MLLCSKCLDLLCIGSELFCFVEVDLTVVTAFKIYAGGCTEDHYKLFLNKHVTTWGRGGIGMGKDDAEWVQSCFFYQQKEAPARQEKQGICHNLKNHGNWFQLTSKAFYQKH